VPTRTYLYETKCQECQKTFYASRRDARFCSATCRTRARRAAAAKDKALDKARAAVKSLMDVCGYEISAFEQIDRIVTWVATCDDNEELHFSFRKCLDKKVG